MKKILIVEDDRRIAQNIMRGLVSENFDAEIAHDGITGKQMALDKKFDLVFWMLICQVCADTKFASR